MKSLNCQKLLRNNLSNFFQIMYKTLNKFIILSVILQVSNTYKAISGRDFVKVLRTTNSD